MEENRDWTIKLFMVMLLTLIVYQLSMVFFAPSRVNLSPSPESLKKTATLPPKEKDFLPPQGEEKIEDIGEFIITYDESRGYIKQIKNKKYEWIVSAENVGYIPEYNQDYTVSISPLTITFTHPQGIEKKYTFSSYQITLEITAPRPTTGVIFSNTLKINNIDERYKEFFYKTGQTIKRQNLKKVSSINIKDSDFVGIIDRYFVCAILNQDKENKKEMDIKKEGDTVYFLTQISGQKNTISLFIGPQKEEVLQEYNLSGVVRYGIFHGISQIIYALLYLLYSLFHNWGWSIIVLSIIIYFLLFPFTAISTKSMVKLSQLSPKIEELRKKFQNDPIQLQKEISKLYKKYKVNPLGGCLPLFLQIPVFIALYQILWRLIDLKGATFFWIKDLTLPDRLIFIPTLEKIPIIEGYINILPLIMLFITIFQQKIMTSRQTTQNSQQKILSTIMPIFISIIFYNFPSGLVLYWLIQNVLSLLYQYSFQKQLKVVTRE